MIKNRFLGYIILIGVALLCLSVIQYYWINSSIKLKQDEIETKTTQFLNDIVHTAEEGFYCVDFFTESMMNEDDAVAFIRKDSGSTKIDTLSLFYSFKNYNDSVYNLKNISFEYPAKVNTEIHVQYIINKKDIARQRSDYSLVEKQTIYSYRDSLTDKISLFNQIDTLTRRDLAKITGDEKYILTIFDGLTGHQNYPSAKIDIPESWNKIESILFEDDHFFQPYIIQIAYPASGIKIISSQWVIILTSFLTLLLIVILLILFIKKTLQIRKLAILKSEFIHNMTHEFKTPVSNINLAIDTLEKQTQNNVNNNTGSIISIIRAEISRLMNNLDTIIKSISLERKEIQIDHEEIDMHDLLERIIQTYPLETQNKNAVIETSFKAKNNYAVVDEIHLTNVIYNFIDNALKYSKNGIKIKFLTDNNKDKFILTVDDNGIGIAESDLPYIFDAFYRVPTGKIHNVKGLGLGLSYVKYIITQLNGTIKVFSKPGEGTRFIITLPLK